jgi:ureidoglycolate hydrolase
MREISAEPLTTSSFERFGYFADLLQSEGRESIGTSPIVFLRDIIRLPASGPTHLNASVCQVEPMERIVDVLETHDLTDEAILPLDGDLDVQFAPATAVGLPMMERV